jgi:hypothetical protein
VGFDGLRPRIFRHNCWILTEQSTLNSVDRRFKSSQAPIGLGEGQALIDREPQGRNRRSHLPAAVCFSVGNLDSSGRGPICDRGQTARCLLPSNPESTQFRHDEVRPSEPPGTPVESNNRHATCNGFPPDTNNPLSTQTRGLVFAAEREPHGVGVAGQF